MSFRDIAMPLRASGFAVIPADGKKPRIARFNTFRRAPSEKAVAKWSKTHACASSAMYVPGISCGGLVVIDVDNMDQVPQIIAIFGDTPAKVLTRRGMHLLYRKPKRLRISVSSLKSCGLDVDLKYDNCLVVAPGSVHEDGKHVYRWADENFDAAALKRLPVFDMAALSRILNKSRWCSQEHPNVTYNRVPPAPCSHVDDKSFTKFGAAELAKFRDGSRAQELNDRLCAHAPYCDDIDELLDKAYTFNSEFADKGIAPLAEKQVREIANRLWKQVEEGKIEKRFKHKAVAKLGVAALDLFMDQDNGDDALMLLLKLRAEHGGRMTRGDTFALAVKSMVKAKVMRSNGVAWGNKRYFAAISTLIETGFLIKVAASKVRVGRGRTPAQYRLADRYEVEEKGIIE